MLFLLAGVCEPIDTPMCQEKNKLFEQELNCEQKKNCAALNEPGRGELLSWRVIYNSRIGLLIYSCQIDIPFCFHFAYCYVAEKSFHYNCVVGSTYQTSEV